MVLQKTRHRSSPSIRTMKILDLHRVRRSLVRKTSQSLVERSMKFSS